MAQDAGNLNAQVLQALNAVATAMNRNQGQIKMEPFKTGDSTDWMFWRMKFEDYARDAQWNADVARGRLYASVQDEAFAMVSDIDIRANGLTLAQALNLYEERFMPPQLARAAQAEFRALTQNTGESVQVWHNRARGLFNRAYAARAANADTDEQLIATFCDGLAGPKIREATLRRNPATMQEALAAAVNEENLQRKLGTFPLGHHRNVKAEPGVRAMSNVKCFGCSQFGHFKRDCPNRKAEDAKASGQKGGKGKKKGQKGQKKKNRGVNSLGTETGTGDASDGPQTGGEEQGGYDPHEDGSYYQGESGN